jgi:acyl-CoA reductase-like NAD-dependent aldehyde dehydrogenase
MSSAADDLQPRRWALPIGSSQVDDGDFIDVVDKFSGLVAYEVATASKARVTEAIAAARGALADPLPAHRRFDILAKAAAILRERADELVETLIAEGGKPRKASVVEVNRSIETLQWSAEEAKRIAGEAFGLDASPTGVGRFAITLREPVGVVAAISPSNSPLNLVVHKVGPALAGGNAVVLKPPQVTPVCSLLLAEILRQAGLPDGYLNVVVGSEVGDTLLAHPDVNFYNFTGSVGVGEHLRRTIGLRRALLELGGNSPVIVHADADVVRAAEACASKGFTSAGQACTSVQRIYAHRSIFAAFVTALVTATEGLHVGDPNDPRTDLGPMLSLSAADHVYQRIETAVNGGARRATGGKRDGATIWPTVLVDVPEGADIRLEEAFGPVVVVDQYDDLEDALDRANSTPYGLHAAIFTSSLDTAFHAVRRLESGAVLINEATQWRTEFVPFGGIKSSGSGREGPKYAVEEMTQMKLAMFNLSPPAPTSEQLH